MIEAATVNAISMIMLLRAIEAMYPGKSLAHPSICLTTPATTTPNWCRLGWACGAAGSNCTSSPPIARIWIPLSGYGD